MQRLIIIVLAFCVLAFSSSCVYRSPIAQGNFIDQEDLDQLELGMTRSQVRFLLGTPMIDDPFHKNRWDYVYYIKIGRKQTTYKRWVSVFFDEGDLVIDIRKDLELAPEL